jgi:hypothetical protein
MATLVFKSWDGEQSNWVPSLSEAVRSIESDTTWMGADCSGSGVGLTPSQAPNPKKPDIKPKNNPILRPCCLRTGKLKCNLFKLN